jgi:arginyl-tRNA--protein-N-Asp/Glu arginylyltransferase
MVLFQMPAISEPEQCPYLAGREFTYEYFLARDLDENELNEFLSRGWRKFGYYYFRPTCEGCSQCIPIRVLVDEFTPSKNQKKIMRKGRDISVRFSTLRYTEEIYDMYRDHSKHRFGNEALKDEFIFNFYLPSCPSLQSEYYLDGTLIAVGFLDITSESLSSVYFIYRSGFDRYSLGTLGVIREITCARMLNLRYYYLGYYIADNHFMAYKSRFKPHEEYNWEKNEWQVSV